MKTAMVSNGSALVQLKFSSLNEEIIVNFEVMCEMIEEKIEKLQEENEVFNS